MKKVFVMMILMFSIGMVFGDSLTILSSGLYGSGGIGDTDIATGEQVTLIFNYKAIDTPFDPAFVGPIIINYLYVVVNDDFTEITNFVAFSGSTSGSNIAGSTTFTMPFISGAGNSATLELYFQIVDEGNSSIAEAASITSSGGSLTHNETLPVELSAFDAVATAEDFVNINWTVQSETNISGYFIIRGLQNDIDSAQMIPAFINATNGTQEHSYTFTDKEVTPNSLYFYWLQSVEFSLQTELFGPTMVQVGDLTGGESVPVAFGTQLLGNYPNPFNPSTSVSFSVANPGHVTIDIYNIKGQLVKNLYNNNVSANKVNQRIDVLWNGRDNNSNEIASGVYYTKMKAGNKTDFKKMLLMK